MKLLRVVCFALGAAIALAGAEETLMLQASIKAKRERNPYEGSDEARRAGAKLYARECAACHGRDRQGGERAPALDQPEVRDAAPGALFWILRNGDLRHGMPSFAHLPEAQRWQIIEFLQSGSTR